MNKMNGINRIIMDISPLISEKTAVWPGDTVFSKKVDMSMENGDAINLSSIHTTLHIGAHVDAPAHTSVHGCTIDKQPLSLYYGECQVIEVHVSPGNTIFPKNIKDRIKTSRILLKTKSYPDLSSFNNSYNGLSEELVEFFYSKKVKLVGIDTPSVDTFINNRLTIHRKMAEYNISILEGLVLKDIVPGMYTLIAFPLKIENADASPVRAVLIK
jgi:arylformamidase